MKVEYREEKQAGHGKLVFSESMFPDAPWSVAIQRASDKLFLTGRPKKPWVGETFYLELNGAPLPDGSLELEIGPSIVDRLDQQDIYRIYLKGSNDFDQKAQLRLGTINYSPSGSLDNTAEINAEDESEPQTASPPGQKQEVEAPKSEQEQSPPPEAAPERLEMDEQAPKQKASPHYLRWALIALLFLGCVAWYWLDPRNRGDTQPEQASKEAVAPETSPQQSAEDRVRNFFRGGKITPKEAAELAAELPKTTKEEQDAVYRLYYFAAENGEPSVLLDYGACLDPSRPAWGSIEKNAPEAWQAYEKSPDKEKSAADLKHLRDWLESQSRSGNNLAMQWLREIEK